jgi:hypothetical protein
MKAANDVFNDLLQKIGLPAGYSISLCEVEPPGDDGQNWIVGIGNLPRDVQSRYEKAYDEMKKLHPMIDWNAVKVANGERRCISGAKLS